MTTTYIYISALQNKENLVKTTSGVEDNLMFIELTHSFIIYVCLFQPFCQLANWKTEIQYFIIKRFISNSIYFNCVLAKLKLHATVFMC